MIEIFKYNAYNVLGLDTTSSQRDIVKRSKEINKYFEIDESADYDIDVNIFKKYRTRESVNESLQKLQSPRRKVKEYFFWFQIVDEIDERAMDLIRQEKYHDAIQVWDELATENSIKAFLYQKNIAILYSSLISSQDNEKYLHESIVAWKSFIESDLFWTNFKKMYKLYDNQIKDEIILEEFRKNVVTDLADIYIDLYRKHKNPKYVSEFQKTFSTNGNNVEKHVLDPIFQEINEAVISLEEMNASEDGILDEEETRTIKNLLKIFQSELNKLIDLGLYDNGLVKDMRDRAAEAIRVIVLDLHNNLSETEKSIALLNIALQFAGTGGTRSAMEQDINKLSEIQSQNDIVKPIISFMDKEEYNAAWELIKNNELKPHDNELQSFYKSMKQRCILEISLRNNTYAIQCLDNKQDDTAKEYLDRNAQFIYRNIDLFDFEIEFIDSTIDAINKYISQMTYSNFSGFDEYRKSYIERSQKRYGETLEANIFILLVNAYLLSGFAGYVGKYRQKQGNLQGLYTLGWLTIWIYGLGMIFFIVAWIYQSRD